MLTTLARQLHVAFPILLVLGGLVLGFVPGVPSVALPPNLVLLLFLPPLLFVESLSLSFRDLLHSIRTIVSLAGGLVVATIGAVAVIIHTLVPGFSWATAFVLGAIVGPTDEVAATAIAERLEVPARLIAVIEDESLLNDAFSLVAYSVAVTAVVSGRFSPPVAGVDVIVAAVGGIAVGLAVGWVVAQVRRRLNDPPVELTFSLLTGYAAYLPANALHWSGVLAVVACGIYLARRGAPHLSAQVRLQSQVMWELVTFLLNGILFILVGLQLHRILNAISTSLPVSQLLLYALVVVLTVVVLRVLWVFATESAWLRPARRGSRLSVNETAVVAWTGMRGAVSLAAALAIPLAAGGGGHFPDRELIIFLTYAVILSTLAVQGLTLPVFIQWLGLAADPREQREEVAARLAALQAGLERLNSASRDGVPEEMIGALRARLENTARQVGIFATGEPTRVQRAEQARYRQIVREVIDAERQAVVSLRDEGIISDDVMRRVARELDLEQVRLESVGVES